MKKTILLIVSIIFYCFHSTAQVPQSFKYQAVARDASGEVIADQKVSFQISILQSSETGTSVYSETHVDSTNQFGLVTLEIGTGTTTDDFTAIDWGNDAYFIQIEMDATGGTSYTLIGTSQLLSVPYALYAKSAGNGFSGSYNDLTNKPTLFDSTWTSITEKPTTIEGYGITDAFNGTWVSLTGKPTTIAGYGITDFDFTGVTTNDLLKFDGTKWTKFTPNYLTSEVDGSVTNEIEMPTNAVAGDMSYFDGTNWIRVPKGTVGQILTMDATNVPYWQNGSAFSNPIAPTATALAASNVLMNSVTFNGTVNANGFSTMVQFEYGTTIEYGSIVDLGGTNRTPVIGNTNTNVSENINALLANTEYHFRLKTSNAVGVTYSDDLTFTTSGAAPTVTSLAATSIISVGAKLNGTVNANGFNTTVSFDYGTNTGYGSSATATQSSVTGNTDTDVEATITGLTLGTTYHFRVKAVNALGTIYGSDMTFIAAYGIGENINGGFVFYIDGTDLHGLVCAPTDQSTGAIWGCIGTLITGADGIAVGTGNQNTIDIVNGCSTAGIAARLCNDLDLNGYTDWFLPSIDELGLMYTNLYLNELGHLGGLESYSYYSSSEYNSDWAWFYNFGIYSHPRCYGGAQGEGANKDGYDGVIYKPSHVRAVRAF